MIASVTAKLFTVLGRPALADSDASRQLRSFQAWSHSPLTAILLAIAFAGLVVLVITPPGRRFFGRQAGAIGQGVVIFLGSSASLPGSAAISGSSSCMAALWGYLAWVILASGLCGGLDAARPAGERAQPDEAAGASRRADGGRRAWQRPRAGPRPDGGRAALSLFRSSSTPSSPIRQAWLRRAPSAVDRLRRRRSGGVTSLRA